MKLESQRQDSQDSKEHEKEIILLHRTAKGKYMTQIHQKYAELVLSAVVENLQIPSDELKKAEIKELYSSSTDLHQLNLQGD